MVVGGEMPALHRTQPLDQQHGHAHDHVETVKTRQHEERGPVDTRVQGQSKMGIGFVVLENLQGNEQHPQGDSDAQPDVELALVAVEDTHVGDMHGDAG